VRLKERMVAQWCRKPVAVLLLVSLVLSSVLMGGPSPPLGGPYKPLGGPYPPPQSPPPPETAPGPKRPITAIVDDSPEQKLPEEDPYVTTTFRLQHCACERTLRVLRNATTAEGSRRYLADDVTGPDYWKTTCSEDAVRRGPGQQVVAYSFYGSPTAARHKAKQYFAGIVENLALLPRLYPGWVMRLYYDLEPEDDPVVAGELCELACSAAHLDLCYARRLPGTPMRDARRVFAMNWRFFPTLDPQVYLYSYSSLTA
jgi:hypothetical protein